jgi:outer membrane protein OmpA-like peptidoglycan-associated protein
MIRAALLLPLAALLGLGAAPAPRDACNTPARTATSYCTPVFFEDNSIEIPHSALPILDKIVAEVADNDGAKVVVAGYVDAPDAPSSAMVVSRRIATNVRDYLVGQGVSLSAIAIEPYGATRPLSPVAGGKPQPENRRVEIWVIY